MNVINDKGKTIEEVNLDPLYDRLALNEKTENNNEDIYQLFESELGRTLSPMEYEKIKEWITSGNSNEMISLALKEAVLNGVNNFSFKLIHQK